MSFEESVVYAGFLYRFSKQALSRHLGYYLPLLPFVLLRIVYVRRGNNSATPHTGIVLVDAVQNDLQQILMESQ